MNEWAFYQSYQNQAFLAKFGHDTQISLQNRNILTQVFLQIQLAQGEQRGYLLDGSPDSLVEFAAAKKRLHTLLLTLNEYWGKDPAQGPLLKELDGAVDLKVAEMQGTIDQAQAGDLTGAVGRYHTGVGRKYTQDIADCITRLGAQETRKRRAQSQ